MMPSAPHHRAATGCALDAREGAAASTATLTPDVCCTMPPKKIAEETRGASQSMANTTATSDATPKKVRIDAWVWAVRLIKTRSDATAACRAGHIKLNGNHVKPAQPVAVGDRVRVWVNHREYEVEVTQLIAKRVGAAVARTCYIDHTPERPELEQFVVMPKRDRGAGKPAKQELRELRRLKGRIP